MKRSVSVLGHCMDWRVLAVLAGGIAIALYAPRVALAAVPVLLVLACPISMLLMMRVMNRGNSMSSPPANPQPDQADQGLSPDPQLSSLEDQLRRVQAQHAAIAQQIAGLDVDAGRDQVPAAR